MAMFLVLGAVIGILLRPSPKNQVLYFRERDGRGHEYNIETEDAISVETVTDPSLRFFKWGRAYSFKAPTRLNKLKTVNRFLGKEGSGYTWKLYGFDRIPSKYKTVEKLLVDSEGVPVYAEGTGEQMMIKEEVPIEWESKTVECEFPSLEDAVKFRWGKDFYNTVPVERQEQLQDDKILVTVGLEPGLTPQDYKPVDEQMRWKVAEAKSAEVYASKVREQLKTPVLNYIPWIGAGVAIALIIAILLGWIQIAQVPKP